MTDQKPIDRNADSIKINLATDDAVERQQGGSGAIAVADSLRVPEAEAGQAFTVSSPLIDTLNDSFNARLKNPSGSGVRVAIDTVTVFNNSGVIGCEVQQNPTWEPASAQRTPVVSRTDGSLSNTEFYAAETTSSLGGTALDIDLLSFSQLLPFDVEIDIAPGDSIGLRHSTGDLSSVDSVWMAVSYVEYPA